MTARTGVDSPSDSFSRLLFRWTAITLFLFGFDVANCSGQQPAVQWYDATRLTIEGRGWPDAAHPYIRLPAKAEGLVRRPVWELGQHSAGVSVRFVTDAPTISARWSLISKRLEMPHM